MRDGGGVERLRRLLAERLGMAFDDKKDSLLAEILQQRATQHGLSDRGYLDRLATAWTAELAALAEALTVNETYFFRNIEQFRVLDQVALPERLRGRAGDRRLDLLSVGCSTGEEAYTLAMVVAGRVPDGWETAIVGLDVNRGALRKAMAGRYSTWSLRETPEAARRRWFQAGDDGVEIDARLRGRVRFVEHNVAREDLLLFAPDTYDVVFCRNLLMYLTPDAGRAVVERITRALTPGGYLFLGHTDTLGSRPPGLSVHHSHGTFYYRRETAQGDRRETAPGDRRETAQGDRRETARREGAPGDWRELARKPEARPVARKPEAGSVARKPEAGSVARQAEAVPVVRPRPREQAVRLLQAERFGDALRVLDAITGAEADRPDTWLVRGCALAHLGDTGRAAELCRRLLERDSLFADAHQLLADCCEGDDDHAAAQRHHRIAAQLDAGFAMPRLRLGLLARRLDDRRTAEVELDRAVRLLRDETAERIALFGGGFGRAALIALCRAELAAVS
ncbi:CheR family methyltransferase [Dactylosporangium sp. CA-092794]|uniref:CheR family methyltransferase n=1 Tax=Dactylosporangium sp. CA-092794 TaxID=3239929 RepID=UPI003D9270F8